MFIWTSFKEWIAPWVEPLSEDPLEAHRERMLNLVLLGLGIPGLAFGLLFAILWGLGMGRAAGIGALAGLVVQPFYFLAYWLGRRGKVQAAAYIPVVTLFLLMVVTNFVLGVGHSSMVGYAIVVVIAGVLLGTRPAVGAVVLSALSYLAAGWAQTHNLLPHAFSAEDTIYLDAVSTFLGLTTIVAFSWISRHEVGGMFRRERELVLQLESHRVALEQRVAERTAELKRRVAQLEAAAQVSREAAGIRDVDVLMETVSRILMERLGASHVNVFLVNDRRTCAVLQASSSMAGKRLVEQGYKQRIGARDVVGYVAETGKPVSVSDTDAEIGLSVIRAFPDTRSEMGLPLVVRGEILGVLDVHSDKVAAFSTEDVEAMQPMADQVALAIENARLLEASQRALRELESLYGKQVREAWRERVEVYRYTGVDVVEESPSAELPLQLGADVETVRGPVVVEEEEGRRLVAPILLRGQKLGAIVLRQEEGVEPWTSEELALLNEIGVQIGLALENARLLEETQRRAEREQMLGEMTARLTRSLDMGTMLRAAVRELAKLPNVTEVAVHVGPPS